jgi:PAS domain S-box-containing protein
MSEQYRTLASGPAETSVTLLLLVESDRNRELLTDRLSDDFEMLTGDDDPFDGGQFDVCLVDERSLRRHSRALDEAKSAASPTFLPSLLLAGRRSPDEFSGEVWSLVDEVVTTPVSKAALSARIDNLVQRRQLSKELTRREEQSKKRFEALFQSTPDPVVVVTSDGTITEVNDAFSATFGVDPERARGRAVTDLRFTPRESVERVLLHVTDEDEPTTATVKWRDGTSDPLIAELNTDVVTGLGEAAERIGIFRNVTERQKYERRLEKQRDRLELLNQVLRHDIRNDVQVVTGTVEMAGDHVDEEGAEYIEQALERSRHVVELTQTARDLAETMLEDEGKRKPVSVGRAVSESVEKADSTGDREVVVVDGDLPDATVLADDMLASVFHNLLQNAIEHNPADEPTVSVSVDEFAETVVVRVADDGPGIPDDRTEAIFGKGEKGLESPGTGLGLYLVKTLVDQYGGDVRVEENDPEGSVFSVELPKASPR